jgi:hypothetical protein
MKNDNLKRNDATPPIISGDFVPVQSVVAVTNMVVTGPYRGDFQVVDQGRVIVGEDPDTGPRGILAATALRGYNANGINTFAVWFATTEGHAPGDMHAGNLAGNYLKYDQTQGTLGLYTPDGAGVIMDNDGTFIAGHQDHGHMKWDAVTGSLKIMSGAETMAEVGDDGNAQFTGIITATGGHITGRMFVDEVLQAGDVDGPAIYMGRFERTNDLGEPVETSEIIATDAANLPWFHVVAGGETSGGGYFHLGGTGDYSENLSFDGERVVLSGALVWAGGKGVADASGISHTENDNSFWQVKPGTSKFMEINTSGSDDTYNALRVTEDTGIGIWASGGEAGVFGRSLITDKIGVWGYAPSGNGVRGTTETSIGGFFQATDGGRGVVATTNSATLAGVVARNTGGGPALVLEDSYMNAATQSIINVGALTLDEVATPGAVSNHAVLYAEDNGSGKTRLMVRFGSGAAVQLAIEP